VEHWLGWQWIWHTGEIPRSVGLWHICFSECHRSISFKGGSM